MVRHILDEPWMVQPDQYLKLPYWCQDLQLPSAKGIMQIVPLSYLNVTRSLSIPNSSGTVVEQNVFYWRRNFANSISIHIC